MAEQFSINGKEYTFKSGKTSISKPYIRIEPCPNGKIRREVAANLQAKSYVYDDEGMTCWL